jgi:DNA-binding response OmpR family regulator
VRALVADDDRIAARMIAASLTRWQIDVDVAHDGNEAWTIITRNDTPTLAVVDWMMPNLDGLELCRRIRQDLSRSHVYAILLTGRDDRADVVAGLDAGADDYMIKPFDREEFRARVDVGIRVLTLHERVTERIQELGVALANVKQLRGLLPICSYCKRIRGDDQYWQQVDSYLVAHTDAQFSQVICPGCSEKLAAGG